MLCWWALSQTPVNNSMVSRNVRMIYSPHTRPWRAAKRCLQLVSLSQSRKTDALEKHRKTEDFPQLLNCSSLFWKLYLNSACASEQHVVQRLVIQNHKLLHVFHIWRFGTHMETSNRGHCKVFMTVSMWLLHPTNLCHYIIVFKWFAHWQMMCD